MGLVNQTYLRFFEKNQIIEMMARESWVSQKACKNILEDPFTPQKNIESTLVFPTY